MNYNPMPIGSKGPRSAKIVIVGEAPGADEVRAGLPFVGASGKELDRMLADAGIDPSQCYYTNVTLVRPPDNDIDCWVQRSAKRKKITKTIKKATPDHWVEHRGWLVEPHVAKDATALIDDIKEINPNVVIALGNTPFWALCDDGIKGKVGTWRGSELQSRILDGTKVFPAYHPAFILRNWAARRITVQDLRRANYSSQRREATSPNWDFTVAPTFDQVMSWLYGLWLQLEAGPTPFTCDIEGAQMKTLCVGLATSSKRAICIPLLYKKGWYFSLEQGHIINVLLQRILRHPNARVINQNIGFDTQWLVKDVLAYPRIYWDTMIAQNILFPGTPMSLAYQASMYCSQYRYWKDDSEEFWKAKRISNWEQIWFYNCEDVARTFEVYERQAEALRARNLVPQFEFLQNRIFRLIRKAMFRGVRVDVARKEKMLRELEFVIAHAENKVNLLATRQLNINSPQQVADLFYKELRMAPVLSDEDRPTCDADALVELAARDPLVRRLVKWINLVRSYGTAVDVCKAKVEADLRWHCSYSLGLVETYRLSSSKNPFGRGLNLMNITSGKEVKGDDEDDDE